MSNDDEQNQVSESDHITEPDPPRRFSNAARSSSTRAIRSFNISVDDQYTAPPVPVGIRYEPHHHFCPDSSGLVKVPPSLYAPRYYNGSLLAARSSMQGQTCPYTTDSWCPTSNLGHLLASLDRTNSSYRDERHSWIPMDSSPYYQSNMPLSTSAVNTDMQAGFAILFNRLTQLFDIDSSVDETSEFDPATTDRTPLQLDPSINPQSWSISYRWICTCLAGLTMFNASFASTAPNGAAAVLVRQMHMTDVEMVFVATSFVGGCVAGPIVWAPLSELYGRRRTFLVSNFLYTLTNIGCALSQTKQQLFGSRFLAGTFASSAFSNAGAVITDLFPPDERGDPMIIVSMSPLLGPCFGPLTGSLISEKLDWRYVFWILGAIGLVLEVMLFFLPETYLPVIVQRHKKLKGEHSAPSPRLETLILVNLARPIRMMFVEPIVVCATFYLSFFFALMYVCFASWPLIFGPPGLYQLSPIHTGFTFVPMAGGGLAAALLVPWFNRYYKQTCALQGHPVPEARLLPTFFVGPFVAVGLLWAGWFARPSVPYVVTMLAGVPIGAAMVWVFQGWIGYLGDCYRLYASSAIAATVIGRSLSGATLPLSTHKLHQKLGGIAWLYTLLACLVALTIPIPYLVHKHGQGLRNRSSYKLGR